MFSSSIVVSTLLSGVSVDALDNGLARVPPMGWATWNAFHRHWTEDNLYATVDAFVSNGMKDVGYEYINVDGGWWEAVNGTIVRNATGHPTYSKQKYPNGLPTLVDYIHSHGLKYGHYSDAGTAACDGDGPMSEGYEEQDVAVFVHEWKADMIKLDACNTVEQPEVLVKRWRDLLNATGRPVLFSNCHNGCETSDGELPSWCAELSNMWRTHGDIKGTWKNVLKNVDSLKGRGTYGRPGAWNDPDFLECHIGEFTFNGTQLSLDMNRAHFAMWAITSSPLIVSPDLRTTPQEIVDIFTDEDVIAIDQQYAGNAGDFVKQLLPSLSASYPSTGVELWAKPLPNERIAVAIFNRGAASVTVESFDLTDLPGLNSSISEFDVLDVWTKSTLQHTGRYYSVGELRARSVELLVFSHCSNSFIV